MTKKQLVLIALVLACAGAYFIYLTDWFKPEEIQIACTIRPQAQPRRPRNPGAPAPAPVNTVTFTFDRKLKLTDVKVIPVPDLETNKYAHPIWHLVSESNSIPLKSIAYGGPIRGMHPKVKGAVADRLDPKVKYRLFIESDVGPAEREFQTSLPH